MPLRVRERRGTRNLYITGTVLGRFIDRSARTDNEDAAEKLRIKWEAEELDRSIHGTKAVTTFAGALAYYLRSGGSVRYTGALLDHFGTTRLSAIDQLAIDACATKLCGNVSAASRKRMVTGPIAAILHRAAEAGLCDYRRVRHPSVSNTARRALEPDEVNKLLQHAPNDRLRALALFMLYTGRRLSECVELEWKDVRLAERQAFIGRTKNGQSITVHLAQPVVVALANLPDRAGRVFGYTSRHGVRTAWSTMCRRAGIAVTRHEFGRHTCATWLRRYGGLDLQALMEAMGWRSINSALAYKHVNASEVQKAVDLLPDVTADSRTASAEQTSGSRKKAL
jgi:integrase